MQLRIRIIENIVEIKNMVKYFGPEDKIKVEFEY